MLKYESKHNGLLNNVILLHMKNRRKIVNSGKTPIQVFEQDIKQNTTCIYNNQFLKYNYSIE